MGSYHPDGVDITGWELNMRFANYVDGASEHCDACRAFDGASCIQLVGTTEVSMPDAKVQVVFLLLGDLVALSAIDPG